jgi:hypothetical protein
VFLPCGLRQLLDVGVCSLVPCTDFSSSPAAFATSASTGSPPQNATARPLLSLQQTATASHLNLIADLEMMEKAGTTWRARGN